MTLLSDMSTNEFWARELRKAAYRAGAQERNNMRAEYLARAMQNENLASLSSLQASPAGDALPNTASPAPQIAGAQHSQQVTAPSLPLVGDLQNLDEVM